MLLSNVAPIAATISGFSATASLIYVSIQTRQSVRHARALIHQGTAARTTNLLLGWMNEGAVVAWIEGNGGIPSPESIRQRQFYLQCGTTMIAMEDYFSQHEEGLLGDEQFARGSATFRQALIEPGLKAYWLRTREMLVKAAPRYCLFVDSLCVGETHPLEGPDRK